MGGCCCGLSKGAAVNTAQAYYYYPRASEGEHVPSSTRGRAAVSAYSTGLLVDTNLDTSASDAYRPLPISMPLDMVVLPETPRVALHAKDGGATHVMDSGSALETVHGGGEAREGSGKCRDVKGSDCKVEIDSELELGLEKDMDLELKKSVELFDPSIEEEDSCPICLEEYDVENPKLTTKCQHHYHLACILEWMERSDSCPVCDKEMIFDPPIY